MCIFVSKGHLFREVAIDPECLALLASSPCEGLQVFEYSAIYFLKIRNLFAEQNRESVIWGED